MLVNLLACVVVGQTAAWPVIPRPAEFRATGGTFDINRVKVVMAKGQAAATGKEVAAELTRDLGHTVAAADATIPENSTVILAIDSNNPELGDEGYAMVVTQDSIIAAAKTQAGLFYASQTIRELALIGKPVPCGSFEDKPRFGWRGLHLDVSRHFFGPDEIKHMLDVMSMYKFNVFHWHLVDDGGWRIEIKSHPELTAVGAWRDGDGKWGQPIHFAKPTAGKQSYGGFYTQDQVKDIVAYAAARHITVVPEIEMPGHSLPGLATNAELRCTPKDAAAKAVFEKIGDQNVYCAGKPASYKFLEDVLTEVMALFPSTYIHVGGDEVDKTWWANCADCQALMKREGLKSTEELQSHFIQHFDKYLADHGRHLMGWDEILEGGLAPGAAVMSWRGIDGGIAAAKAGHKVVMSPTSHCYFDYPYSSISTEKVYGWDPVPQGLTTEQGKLVLGGQANLWTEWMNDYQRVMAMTYPRALAMSEVLWSPTEGRSWPEFEKRMNMQFPVLDKLKVSYMVPSPTLDYTAAIFSDRQTLPFGRPPMENATLRYTVDNTPPTTESPVAPSTMTLDKTARIRLAYFLPDGRHSDEAVLDAVKIDVPHTGALTETAYSRRIIRGDFKVCPPASAFSAAPSVKVSQIGIEGITDKAYGAYYTGWFVAPTDGDYTFALTSDDGSMMWLAGAQVVANDGPHGPATQRGRVRLQRGAYPLTVSYFEAGGGHTLTLTVTGPDGKTKRI